MGGVLWIAGVAATAERVIDPRVFLCSGMAGVPGLFGIPCLTFLIVILIPFSLKSSKSSTLSKPSFCSAFLWTVVSPICEVEVKKLVNCVLLNEDMLDDQQLIEKTTFIPFL